MKGKPNQLNANKTPKLSHYKKWRLTKNKDHLQIYKIK